MVEVDPSKKFQFFVKTDYVAYGISPERYNLQTIKRRHYLCLAKRYKKVYQVTPGKVIGLRVIGTQTWIHVKYAKRSLRFASLVRVCVRARVLNARAGQKRAFVQGYFCRVGVIRAYKRYADAFMRVIARCRRVERGWLLATAVNGAKLRIYSKRIVQVNRSMLTSSGMWKEASRPYSAEQRWDYISKPPSGRRMA
jgi:hypothetical protein